MMQVLSFTEVSNMAREKNVNKAKYGSNVQFRIGTLKIRGGFLRIEGHHEYQFQSENDAIAVKFSDGRITECERYRIPRWDHEDENGNLIKSYGFRISIPVRGVKSFKFYYLKGGELRNIPVTFGYFSKLSLQKGSYYAAGKHIVRFSEREFFVEPYSKGKVVKYELGYLFKTVIPKGRLKIALFRLYSLFRSFGNHKPIWIVSDRDNVARDNGEALFKYISTIDTGNIDVYFALSEDSEDFSRMEQYGQVLALHSLKYKLRFLCADKIISAHASGWTINEFGDNRRFLKDLYDFDYVFLQHGITKDDISSWLNRFNRDIAMFVTAANGEYESILQGSYAYTTKEVKLAGFPRYDYLESKPERKIVFLPTWRKGIGGDAIEGTQHRVYSESFKDTDYCKFYNSLINDERIIQAMKAGGYSAEMYIHPSFFVQAPDFQGNDIIRVIPGVADYSKAFRENALMITDFSSVAFDFAYMRKPVIYTQFDADTFFDVHFAKGYFDYDDDGFGPVCYDYESSVETIVKYIESGCSMEKKYMDRIDDFFAWKDKGNCKRVYDEIMKLEER